MPLERCAKLHSFLAEKNQRFAVAMLILYFKKDLGFGVLDALPKLCAIIDGWAKQSGGGCTIFCEKDAK